MIDVDQPARILSINTVRDQGTCEDQDEDELTEEPMDQDPSQTEKDDDNKISASGASSPGFSFFD